MSDNSGQGLAKRGSMANIRDDIIALLQRHEVSSDDAAALESLVASIEDLIATHQRSAHAVDQAAASADNGDEIPDLNTTAVSDDDDNESGGPPDEGPSEEDVEDGVLYYVSNQGTIYDTRRKAPNPCFNCGQYHWRIQCQHSRGISEEDDVERSSYFVRDDGTRVPLGPGYVRGTANVRARMGRQVLHIANGGDPFVVDLLNEVDVMLGRVGSLSLAA